MRLARIVVALVAAIPLCAGASTFPRGAGEKTEPDLDRPTAWLLAAQHENGGWGEEKGAAPDVGTTAIAGIALIRAGAATAERKAAVTRAVDYVVRAVERVPGGQIVLEREGTQPQRKLGRNIDTFLAAQFLAEAAKWLPPGERKGRSLAALDTTIYKVQKAQAKDGSFARDGWAPVLASAFAAGSLYAAKEAGVAVNGKAIALADKYMLDGFDEKTGQFKTSEAAGVPLYMLAGTFRAAANSGAMAGAAGRAALARLTDENFLRGFGSYGGEEHVSYMMTSEALATAGGAAFERWDYAIRMRLANIQRSDGTWRGDHCITSTTFCTAASLITLATKPGAAAPVN